MRIAITVSILALVAAVTLFWDRVVPIFLTGIAVGQVDDGPIPVIAARARGIVDIPFIAGAVAIALLWLRPAVRKLRGLPFAFVILAIGLTTGCRGPFQQEVFEEIGPSETAFLVPLEGNTKSDQAAFMSIDFLEKAKVATKRVSIPTRQQKTGRKPWMYQWIPTMKVIKVDRVPVTRDWSASPNRGTDNRNQAIEVESYDSIGFSVGATVTVAVEEQDAATFLYHFASKPLSAVADENVRGMLTAVLSREFGNRPLSACKTDKAAIFDIALRELRAEFTPKGVTIRNLGLSEGLAFENPKIQESIDAAYKAEMDIQTAKQEALAQAERNAKKVGEATAEREAAQEFAKAQDAAVAKVRLEIERMKAEAALEAARRWNGATPSGVVPEGSPFLFGMGGGK